MFCDKCEKVCDKCDYLGNCSLLKVLKDYPDGANIQELAQDTQLSLMEVKALVLQLCILGWFVIEK